MPRSPGRPGPGAGRSQGKARGPLPALTSPGSPAHLIEAYEIVYAYSATGAEAVIRAERKPAQRSLLALANPRFGPSSPALPAGKPGAADGSPPAFAKAPVPVGAPRDLLLGERGELAPLPGTQVEAQALKRAFPDATILTQGAAQEGVVKQEAGKYRYLHFATHGLFNGTAPLLSSLALAEPSPDSEEDGFLTAREIFDLRLNADLVVLSACDTGRGEKRSGEGIVGLSWALFAAGASSQVVSQWKVSDASTAELMQRFYAGLGAKKPRGAALREASRALMWDGKHAHPYYWAPFILMGDWRSP